jgi:hypothetical protein
MTTWTSTACFCKARTSSAALYAAIPPDTPTVTLINEIVDRLTASSPAQRNGDRLARTLENSRASQIATPKTLPKIHENTATAYPAFVSCGSLTRKQKSCFITGTEKR